MTVNNTDTFLVERSGTSYKLQAQNLMADLQDADLMLVERGGTSYKATGLDIKNSLGSDEPTFKANASGSISNGDPVVLNSDGTVSSVGTSTTNFTFQTATSVPTTNPGSPNAVYPTSAHAVYVPSQDCIVAFYYGNTPGSQHGIYWNARIGKFTSDTSITWGSYTTITGGQSYIDYASFSHGPLVVGDYVIFGLKKSSYQGRWYVMKVNGSNQTFTMPTNGQQFQPTNLDVGIHPIGYDPATGHVYISHSAYNVNANNRCTGSTLNASGYMYINSNHYESAASPVMQGRNYPRFGYWSVGSNRYVHSYTNSDSQTIAEFKYNGSAMSNSSADSTLLNSLGGVTGFYDSDTDSFIAVASFSDNPTFEYRVFSVKHESADSFATVSPISSRSATSGPYIVGVAKNSHTGKVFANVNDNSFNTWWIEIALTPNGPKIASTSPRSTFAKSGGGYYMGNVLGNRANSSKMIMNDGTNVYMVTPGGTVSNLAGGEFIGFADGSYSNGQEAKVLTQGATSSNQSGLTSGSTYYVQENGTLATTPGTFGVKAGKATSSTAIKVDLT
jgi:hypothetical protein